jgi:hypothetical protein
MKKITLLLTFMMSINLIVFSQIQVKLGGGINASKLTTDDGKWSSDANVGWQVGGSWLLGNKLYFEPGIYYASISSDATSTDFPGLDLSTKINLVRIPAFVGFHILGNASESFFNLRVFGGPTVSFITHVEGFEDLIKDDFKKTQWGMDAGAGINIWWIFLDAGYEWGLSKVFDEKHDTSSKVRAFWANIGIRFNL